MKRIVITLVLMIYAASIYAGFVRRCEAGDTDVRAAIYFNWDLPRPPEFPEDCWEGYERLRRMPELHFSYVDTLDFIYELPYVERLTIDKTKLNSIAPIRSLHYLTSLTLEGAPVADFRPLVDLAPSLRYLSIGADPALSDASLEPLSELYALRMLSVVDGGIRDLHFIESLPELASLTVSGNRLTIIEPLSVLSGLRFLEARDNAISDISVVKSLPLLKHASFRGNRLDQATCHEQLEGIRLERAICRDL